MLTFGPHHEPNKSLFKGVKNPESFEELQSIIKNFLDKEELLSHKKMSRERTFNLKTLFQGLDNFKESISSRRSMYKGNVVHYNKTLFGILSTATLHEDLKFIDEHAALLEEESQKLVGLRNVFHLMQDKINKLDDLMSAVINNSERFLVVRAINVVSGHSSASVTDVKNFLRRNNLTSSDFDTQDLDIFRKYKIEI